MAYSNAFSCLCCRELEMPLKANPINALINADIICLFGHLEYTFVSLFPNFGKISSIPSLKYYIPSFHNIPLDVYINTCME